MGAHATCVRHLCCSTWCCSGEGFGRLALSRPTLVHRHQDTWHYVKPMAHNVCLCWVLCIFLTHCPVLHEQLIPADRNCQSLQSLRGMISLCKAAMFSELGLKFAL